MEEKKRIPWYKMNHQDPEENAKRRFSIPDNKCGMNFACLNNLKRNKWECVVYFTRKGLSENGAIGYSFYQAYLTCHKNYPKNYRTKYNPNQTFIRLKKFYIQISEKEFIRIKEIFPKGIIEKYEIDY